MCVGNVIPVLLAAHAHNATGLKEICLDFIVHNETRLRKADAFKELKEVCV